MSRHRCLDCNAPADWAVVDEAGVLVGYVCVRCDYKRRRRRMGWRRRSAIRARRLFKL